MLSARALILSLALGIFGFAAYFRPQAAPPVRIPAPAVDDALAPAGTQQTMAVAGGCFWGIQAVYEHVKGVVHATSGYAGGDKEHAEYEQVGTGTTGHAESEQVVYDASKISYGKLLQIFFSVAHDPTELNRQGPDEGTQYRSVIWVSSPQQEKIARAYIAQLDAAHVFAKPIVTQVAPLKGFFPAEDYHQDYAYLHPDNLYIVINDAPKVRHLEQVFPELYTPYKGK